MYYLRNENTSLHGNGIQFFLLQLGLPLFHYSFPLEYTLGHDSPEPKKTNIKEKKTKSVPRYILILHTSHTQALGQLGIP